MAECRTLQWGAQQRLPLLLLAAASTASGGAVIVSTYDKNVGYWTNYSAEGDGVCIAPQNPTSDWYFNSSEKVKAAICMLAVIYEARGPDDLEVQTQCLSAGGVGMYPYCPAGDLGHFSIDLDEADSLYQQMCSSLVPLGSAAELLPSFRFDHLPECPSTPAPTPAPTAAPTTAPAPMPPPPVMPAPTPPPAAPAPTPPAAATPAPTPATAATPAPTPPPPATAAPATAAPATAAPTTAAPTTAAPTTAAPAAEPAEPEAVEQVVVEGTLELEVGDPAAFQASPEAAKGVAAAIAEMVGVAVERVKVTISIGGSRRLAPMLLRRLAGTVLVSYTIETSDSTPGPAAISAAIEDTPVSAMTEQISEKVDSFAGAGAFSLTVTTKSAPVIEVRYVTATPTPDASPTTVETTAPAAETTRAAETTPVTTSTAPPAKESTAPLATAVQGKGGLPCGVEAAAVCTEDERELCRYDATCSDAPPRRGGLGCNAGGVGQNCRFCGFDHFLPCEPAKFWDSSPPCSSKPAAVCASASEPCFLDYQCTELPEQIVGLGCNAGGIPNCRFCGFGVYPPCPASPEPAGFQAVI